MVKVKVFSYGVDGYADKQFNSFCEENNITKEQIVSVQLGGGHADAIYLFYVE